MKIAEICEMLRAELLEKPYVYGFILDGRKYWPDRSQGFDAEYDRLARTAYRVQSPDVTMREQIGTCVEAVLVMQKLLDARQIPSRVWLLYNRSKNRVHTILTFQAEGKLVYLELTPQSSKPWYGREVVYADEQQFLADYAARNYDVCDVTDSIVIGQQPAFLLEKLR